MSSVNERSPESSRPVSSAEALTPDELQKMNAYTRAANYLSVRQIYLYDNPLLREPLQSDHIKPRLLGHWGTTPGLNFIYVHLNRLIKKYDLSVIYVTGPGGSTWIRRSNIARRGLASGSGPATTRGASRRW